LTRFVSAFALLSLSAAASAAERPRTEGSYDIVIDNGNHTGARAGKVI
jgi:hypothetical protein